MLAIDSRLSITNVNTPEIKENEALVRVMFVALSFEDLQLRGHDVCPTKLGAAFSGEIAYIQGHSTKFKKGSRVMGFKTTGGAMAQYVTSDLDLLAVVPPRLPLEDAAMIPNPWVSAIHMTKVGVNFTKRERLAIYDANTPTGLITAQLAQLLGCRRVHCVGDPRLPPMDPRKYKLKGALPDEVILYENPLAANNIALYDPKGLEAIIDMRASPEAHLNKLRPGGRLTWGFTNLNDAKSLPPIRLDLMTLKNIRIQGSSIRSLKPQTFKMHMQFIEEHIIPKYISGQLKKPDFRVRNWSQIGSFFNTEKLPKICVFLVR